MQMSSSSSPEPGVVSSEEGEEKKQARNNPAYLKTRQVCLYIVWQRCPVTTDSTSAESRGTWFTRLQFTPEIRYNSTPLILAAGCIRKKTTTIKYYDFS